MLEEILYGTEDARISNHQRSNLKLNVLNANHIVCLYTDPNSGLTIKTKND